MGELTRKMNELGIDVEAVALTPAALAGLIRLVDSGTISSPIAKDVFEKMYTSGRAADEIVATGGLARIDDAARARPPHIEDVDSRQREGGDAVPRGEAADVRVPRRASHQGDRREGESGRS